MSEASQVSPSSSGRNVGCLWSHMTAFPLHNAMLTLPNSWLVASGEPERAWTALPIARIVEIQSEARPPNVSATIGMHSISACASCCEVLHKYSLIILYYTYDFNASNNFTIVVTVVVPRVCVYLAVRSFFCPTCIYTPTRRTCSPRHRKTLLFKLIFNFCIIIIIMLPGPGHVYIYCVWFVKGK